MSAYVSGPAALAQGEAPGLGAWVAAFGLASVIATSICYALSPVETVIPVAPPDLAAALVGAKAFSGRISLISAIGIPGDMLTAAGCLALALWHQKRERHSAALGWGIVGLSSFLFLVIDTIAGSVLPAVARAGDAGGFGAIKLMFDQFFIAGVISLAIGGLFLAVPALLRREDMTRPIAIPLLLNALLGLGSGIAAYYGANVPQAMGASIAIAAALLLILAIGAIRTQQSEQM